jgi:molybdopterin molybdotransferase
MGGVSAHGGADRGTGAPLLPVEDARRLALSRITPLPPRETGLREAHGCVLAEDVTAPTALPPFASSAMDGFAVRSADVAGASAGGAVPLLVAGRVAMGEHPNVTVAAGAAVAIPTGAEVPHGADAIVPIEHVVVEGERVLVLRPAPSGRHIRAAGEDVEAGEVLVPAGRRLAGPDLGLLASAGVAAVPVRPRARVGILSTGDELVEPGEERGGARIYDANAFTLHGSVLEAGAVPVAVGRVGDDGAGLADELAAAAPDVDVLITSGGVSVGERDPVKAAFSGGGEVEFVEVAMQPGKPQAFGKVEGLPYFGLPGNPVSVFVSFEVFVRPALMRMMGRPEHRPEVTATVDGELSGPPEKTRFARVRIRREDGGWRATPTGGRQSNLLATASRANGLAVIPRGLEAVRAGERCRVMVFRDPEDP